jgi:hypothetical protein
MTERPNEKFPFTVSITRIADGKTVEIKEEWGYPGYIRDEDWETDPVFLWEEGNSSCDCNRASDFAKASGEPEVETECGEVAYRLNWIRNDETGRLIFKPAST